MAASKEVQLGKIILKPKQTLYSLTRQYHVTEAEVRKLNPNLEMKIGEEVVLPLDKITKYGASELVTTSTPKEVATPAPAQESSSVEKQRRLYLKENMKCSQETTILVLQSSLESVRKIFSHLILA